MKQISLLVLGLGMSFLTAEESVDERIRRIEKN